MASRRRVVEFYLQIKLDKWRKNLNKATNELQRVQRRAARDSDSLSNTSNRALKRMKDGWKRLGEAIRGASLTARRGRDGFIPQRRIIRTIQALSRYVQAAFRRMGASAAGRFVRAMGRGFRGIYRLAARMVERIRARWEKLRKTAQKVSKGIAKAFKLPLKVFKKFVSALRAISSVLLNVKFLATGAIAAFGVFKFAELAAKVSNMEVAFEGLTRALGEAPAQALEKLRKSLRGTVSDLDIARQVARASIFNIADDVDTLAKIFDTARRLGKATGRNTAQAIEDISLGIGRQSRLILDNIGLIVRVRRANEKYAFVLGKQVEDLTDLEKRYAFQLAALDAADEAMIRLGDDVETFGDKFYRLHANLENMSQSIAKTLTPTMSILVDKLNDIDFDRIAKAFANFSGVAFQVMNKSIDRLNKTKGGIAGFTEGIINSINRGGRVGLTLLQGWITRIHGIFTSGNIMGGVSTLMGDVLELAAALIRELIKKIFTWDFWKGILTPAATIIMNLIRVILLELSYMFKSMKDEAVFGGVFEALGDGLSFLTDNLEVASKKFLEGKRALTTTWMDKEMMKGEAWLAEREKLLAEREKLLAENNKKVSKRKHYTFEADSDKPYDIPEITLTPSPSDMFMEGGEAYKAWEKGWDEQWQRGQNEDKYIKNASGRIVFVDADGNKDSGGSGLIEDLFAKLFGFNTWEAIEAAADKFSPDLNFRKAFDGMREVADALLKGAVTNLDKALGNSKSKVGKFARWLEAITTSTAAGKSGRGGLMEYISKVGNNLIGPPQGTVPMDDQYLGPVALERLSREQADDPDIDKPVSLSATAAASGVTLSNITEKFNTVQKLVFTGMASEAKLATEELMLMEISVSRLVEAFDKQSTTELQQVLSIKGLEDVDLDKLLNETGLQVKGEEYQKTLGLLQKRINAGVEKVKKAMTELPARVTVPPSGQYGVTPEMLQALEEYQRREAALQARIVAAEEERRATDRQKKVSEDRKRVDDEIRSIQREISGLFQRQTMSMDELLSGSRGKAKYEARIIRLKLEQQKIDEEVIKSNIRLNNAKNMAKDVDEYRLFVANKILDAQKGLSASQRRMDTGTSYKDRIAATIAGLNEELDLKLQLEVADQRAAGASWAEIGLLRIKLLLERYRLTLAIRRAALSEEEERVLAGLQIHQTALLGGLLNGIKEASLAGAKHYGSFVRSIYKQWAGMLDTFINETVTKIVGTMKSATVDFIESMEPDIAELVGSLANALVGILATIGLSKDSANVTEVSEGDIQAGDTAVRGVIAGPQSVAISELGESIAEANRGVESLLSDILGVLEDIHGNNLTSGGIGSAGTI